MSNVGGFAVARAHPDSRFYHPPPVRRHQQLQHREGVNRTESRVDLSDGRGGWAFQEEEELRDTLSQRPSISAATGESCLSNLDRLIEAVTPSVGVHNFDEYYVPSLSGIQLYIDPARLGRSCEDADAEISRESSGGGSSDCEVERRAKCVGDASLKMNGLTIRDKSSMSSSSDEAEVCNFSGSLVFHYVEQEQPHHRKPFYDKIWNLASQFPDLKKYRSCDILPTSWISVAWYPIYRIPVGPTLQDLDASFLTFHCLSPHSRSISEPHLRVSNGRRVNSTVSLPKFSVPVFGLASYKLKSSILTSSGTNECQRAANLFKAAGNWLQKLQVNLPDYQFFVSHSSTQWR